jgi:hypothetical protein
MRYKTVAPFQIRRKQIATRQWCGRMTKHCCREVGLDGGLGVPPGGEDNRADHVADCNKKRLSSPYMSTCSRSRFLRSSATSWECVSQGQLRVFYSKIATMIIPLIQQLGNK